MKTFKNQQTLTEWTGVFNHRIIGEGTRHTWTKLHNDWETETGSQGTKTHTDRSIILTTPHFAFYLLKNIQGMFFFLLNPSTLYEKRLIKQIIVDCFTRKYFFCYFSNIFISFKMSHLIQCVTCCFFINICEMYYTFLSENKSIHFVFQSVCFSKLGMSQNYFLSWATV